MEIFKLSRFELEKFDSINLKVFSIIFSLNHFKIKLRDSGSKYKIEIQKIYPGKANLVFQNNYKINDCTYKSKFE